jgi:hypothetical protein
MKPHEAPSAAEFGGYYNVPADPAPEGPEPPHLNTFSDVPPLTLDEVNEVGQGAYEVISRYANQRWFTPDEARRYYWPCICKHLEDRTLNVSFMEVDDCTLELIKQLQQLLRTRYPLWRVRIGGSSHESTILIYPREVRYGSLPVGTDEAGALVTVMEREKSLRGAAGGWQNSQRDSLQEAVRSAIAARPMERVIFPIAFDHYHGDSTKSVVWSLCTSDTPDLELLEHPEFMVGDRFRVKPNGDFGYHVADNAPYWIREWIFPKDQLPTRLTFKVYDSNYRPETINVDVRPLNIVRQQGEMSRS